MLRLLLLLNCSTIHAGLRKDRRDGLPPNRTRRLHRRCCSVVGDCGIRRRCLAGTADRGVCLNGGGRRAGRLRRSCEASRQSWRLRSLGRVSVMWSRIAEFQQVTYHCNHTTAHQRSSLQRQCSGRHPSLQSGCPQQTDHTNNSCHPPSGRSSPSNQDPRPDNQP